MAKQIKETKKAPSRAVTVSIGNKKLDEIAEIRKRQAAQTTEDRG